MGPTKCEQDREIDPEGVYRQECGLKPVSFSISLDKNPYLWVCNIIYSLILACAHSGTFHGRAKWHKGSGRDLGEWVGGFSSLSQHNPALLLVRNCLSQVRGHRCWESKSGSLGCVFDHYWCRLNTPLLKQPNKTLITKPEQTCLKYQRLDLHKNILMF